MNTDSVCARVETLKSFHFTSSTSLLQGQKKTKKIQHNITINLLCIYVYVEEHTGDEPLCFERDVHVSYGQVENISFFNGDINKLKNKLYGKMEKCCNISSTIMWFLFCLSAKLHTPPGGLLSGI